MSEVDETQAITDGEQSTDGRSGRPISYRWVTVHSAVNVVQTIREFVNQGRLQAASGVPEVIFLTDIGIVSGNVMTDEEIDQLFDSGHGATGTVNFANLLIEGQRRLLDLVIERGNEIKPDGAFIVIKDAVVRPLNPEQYRHKITFGHPFVLFVDAIKAVTWGIPTD